MKLSPILAQYLLNNKELKLTGIGRFVIDSSYIPDTESRQQRPVSVPDIHFEYDPTVREDTDLISFVAGETGKMKSLTAADLDSHLELARQFLNIGKPFLFEGIGTLTKNNSGKYEFTQGQPPSEKKEIQGRDDLTSTTEESFSEYEEMFSPKRPGTPMRRKIAVTIVIIAGLALAILGGYFVYKKTSRSETDPVESQQQSIITADTGTVKKDSVPQTVAPVSMAGTYRFVIEQSLKVRAMDRFSKLKSYGLNIQMETTDSIHFKLFMVLKATPADTLRIRDSLSLLYVNPAYMKTGKAWVE